LKEMARCGHFLFCFVEYVNGLLRKNRYKFFVLFVFIEIDF